MKLEILKNDCQRLVKLSIITFMFHSESLISPKQRNAINNANVPFLLYPVSNISLHFNFSLCVSDFNFRINQLSPILLERLLDATKIQNSKESKRVSKEITCMYFRFYLTFGKINEGRKEQIFSGEQLIIKR